MGLAVMCILIFLHLLGMAQGCVQAEGHPANNDRHIMIISIPDLLSKTCMWCLLGSYTGSSWSIPREREWSKPITHFSFLIGLSGSSLLKENRRRFTLKYFPSINFFLIINMIFILVLIRQF